MVRWLWHESSLSQLFVSFSSVPRIWGQATQTLYLVIKDHMKTTCNHYKSKCTVSSGYLFPQLTKKTKTLGKPFPLLKPFSLGLSIRLFIDCSSSYYSKRITCINGYSWPWREDGGGAKPDRIWSLQMRVSKVPVLALLLSLLVERSP